MSGKAPHPTLAELAMSVEERREQIAAKTTPELRGILKQRRVEHSDDRGPERAWNAMEARLAKEELRARGEQ